LAAAPARQDAGAALDSARAALFGAA